MAHLKRYGSFSGHPPIFELPADDLTDELSARLHPWIKGFSGLDSNAANQRLDERWKTVKTPCLKKLRDTLARFTAAGIVDFESGGSIAALREPGVLGAVGDVWYLPAPLEDDYVFKRFEQIGMNPTPDVLEFFVHFGGLAENAVAAGSFRYSEDPWPIFADEATAMKLFRYPWSEWVALFGEWHGSLMFYFALNGQFL